MRIDGQVLVDGALTSPTPVWAARRLGAETVLAIRLRPETPWRSRLRRSRVMPPLPDDRPADVEILIDTRDYSAWSSRDVSRLVDLGRRITEQALEEIDDSIAGNKAGLAR